MKFRIDSKAHNVEAHPLFGAFEMANVKPTSVGWMAPSDSQRLLTL